MTDTRSAVESGNHSEKRVVRMARGSRERAICDGRLMFSDFVIFSVRAGSLNFYKSEFGNNFDYFYRQENNEIHAPLPIVTTCSGCIHSPDLLENQLNEHRLEVSAFQMFVPQYLLRFGI